MKIFAATFLILVGCSARLYSQNVDHPNFAMKSHETLEIVKVEVTTEKTVVYLRIENRIDGGSFCTDKNTYLVYPGGNRIKLISSSGIPACPDYYKFKEIGEKLEFTLTFPPLSQGTKWIDLVEDCSENCFWFYGITLDDELNSRLEGAFRSAGESKPEDNIIAFRRILETIDNQNLGIEGLLYINIINAAIEAGNQVEASVWYKRLARSSAPRVQYYLKFLNDKGIKY